MWSRPTLEVERDQALQYGAVPERRINWLEGHSATPPKASTSHASGHPTAMATRQPLDLAAQARALVSSPSFSYTLARFEVLLPADRALDFKENGEGLVFNCTWASKIERHRFKRRQINR